MITQTELNEIESRWHRGGATGSDVLKLLQVAQAFVDTADHVVVAKAEYDWLVQRSHRLEELEV